MAVPSNIISELQFLQNQVNGNQPLNEQSRATITAMQLNADKLVSDVDAAELKAAGQLDTWVQPGDPFALVSSLVSVGVSASDQWIIGDIRSFIGRVASNLNQLV